MNPNKTDALLRATKEVHMTADSQGRWTIQVTDVDDTMYTDHKVRQPIRGLEQVLHKMLIARKKAGKGV